jgi:hypothetical protein
MGGWGSGRHGGRPTVEDGLTVDLGLMLRRGWARRGASGAGTLSWSHNGELYCSISHRYDLTDPDNAHLTLTYTRTRRGEKPTKVEQHIRLSWTRPNYGGRRWWMLCPSNGKRVAKLHMPPGGDQFASRSAWRLPYGSQQSAHRDRPFDRLFRLQRKLGSPEGWEAGLWRPKGMWNRTYERHLEHYWQLDGQCAVEMMGVLSRLDALKGPTQSVR